MSKKPHIHVHYSKKDATAKQNPFFCPLIITIYKREIKAAHEPCLRKRETNIKD